MLRTRNAITLYSGIGFVWFSTRLFGSLRTVLASVFDIENERGIIAGKIFDVKITIVSTLLFVASVTVSTYVLLATKRGTSLLVDLGLRKDVMGGVEYWTGRALAFTFICLMFFALYKYLPVRQVRAKTAWVAATFTSLAFEAARTIFSVYTATFQPGLPVYGTLTAIVVVVVQGLLRRADLHPRRRGVGQVIRAPAGAGSSRERFSPNSVRAAAGELATHLFTHRPTMLAGSVVALEIAHSRVEISCASTRCCSLLAPSPS